MDAHSDAVDSVGQWANPRWHYPEYPAGSVVEIRVHGVGGEGPAGMTRDPHPQNVGGGALAGMWRARNPVAGHLFGERLHVREVLAWGGQTSGTMRHAFWVLLLPFALFNVVGRMHPSDPTSARARMHRALARLLAFTMTLAVVALSAAAAFDLLGVQYPAAAAQVGTGTTNEVSGGWLVAPLRFFAADPAGRMGFVALLPVALLVVLWLAGKYRTNDLEGYDAAVDGQPSEPVRLDDDEFWRNEWSASRLRAAHATGGIAFVGATLALVLADVGPRSQQAGWSAVLTAATIAVLGCGVAIALPATATPGRSAPLHHTQWLLRLLALSVLMAPVTIALSRHLPDPTTALVWALRVIGLGALGWWASKEIAVARGGVPDTRIVRNLVASAGLVLLAGSFPSVGAHLGAGAATAAPGTLPGSMAWLPTTIADWLTALTPGLYLPAYALLLPLTLLQVLLLIGLAITGAQRRLPERAEASERSLGFLWNLGGVVTALLALLLITAVGASIHALLIEWLGERRVADGPAGFVLPWWYGLTAEVAAFALPTLLLAAWIVRQRLFGVEKPSTDAIASDLERGFAGPVHRADTRRLERLASQWLTQRVVRDAGHLLTAATGAATATVVLYLGIVAFDPDVPVTHELPLTSAAVWAVSGLAGGAVGLIRSSLRDRNKRRQVGALWDVLCFWPRVTHPFAPPCYGEAVVPMLERRIAGLRDHGLAVVLAGHSQGSIVALAAAARTGHQVHLVSYGSPTVMLYERLFPGVFGGASGAIVRTQEQAHSWHHLFSMTEPFALPLWAVPGADEHDVHTGWGANRKVPHADQRCPACGWPGSDGSPGGTPRTDFVVSDPDRWTYPLDPTPPRPQGHSTYHHSREVDEHLAHIAAVAARSRG